MMMKNMRPFAIVALVVLLGLIGCTGSAPAESSSTQVPASATQTASYTPTATFTPTATMPLYALITPAKTPTPVTPSATPTVTDTPGPYEHVVQANDQLLAVVQTYGHYDLGVLQEIVRLNANVPSADILPPPGSVIIIPRPTASPTPPGGELTATVAAENPATVTPYVLTMTHVVESGQSLIGIALSYNTTLLILRDLNPAPRLDWRGCDFSNPSGGENCNPPLRIGDEIVVPMPTPTPTLSPTPSGSETPTLTPTAGPTRLLSPAPGVIIMGGPLTLRWVSSGVLRPDELYQITVSDETVGRFYNYFTRDTTFTLPVEVQPTEGGTHQMVWQVQVVRVGTDNVAFAVGAPGEERPFQWIAPR